MVVIRLLHHHREPATLKVEGNLIDLLEALLQLEGVPQLHVLQHSHIQQTFQPGLVGAVQEGQVQHLFDLRD